MSWRSPRSLYFPFPFLSSIGCMDVEIPGALLKCKDHPTPNQEIVTQIMAGLWFFSADYLFCLFSSESMGAWVGKPRRSAEDSGPYHRVEEELWGLGGCRPEDYPIWKGPWRSSLTSSLCIWGTKDPGWGNRFDQSHRWEKHTPTFSQSTFRSPWSFLSTGGSDFLKLENLDRWWSLHFCRNKENIIEMYLSHWSWVKDNQVCLCWKKRNSDFLFHKKHTKECCWVSIAE